MKYGMLCLLLFAGSAWGLNKKETELFAAVQKQDLDKVKKLLADNKNPLNKEKININSRDAEGYTVLLRATDPDYYHYNIRGAALESIKIIIKELIKAGANVNVNLPAPAPAGPFNGHQLSENAAVNLALPSWNTFSEEILKVLLAAGADVSKDKEIVMATIIARPDLANMIIQAGAPVNNVTDGLQRTPLMRAASYGYASTVNLLIQRGADLNVQDSDGRTALMMADNADVVEALLKAGARTDLKDRNGKTAADYQKEYNIMARRAEDLTKETHHENENNHIPGLIHAL